MGYVVEYPDCRVRVTPDSIRSEGFKVHVDQLGKQYVIHAIGSTVVNATVRTVKGHLTSKKVSQEVLDIVGAISVKPNPNNYFELTVVRNGYHNVVANVNKSVTTRAQEVSPWAAKIITGAGALLAAVAGLVLAADELAQVVEGFF